MDITMDNEKRYVFSNWSDEDFTGSWNSVPTTIKAGEVTEFPMYLALHFAKHFVTREMAKAGKETMSGNEEARKEFENKTVSLIGEGVDSPALASLKEKIRAEVEGKEEKVEKKIIKKSKEFGGII